jgi:hypothetical protein
MKADNAIDMVEAVERKTEANPALYDAIARVAPAMRNFELVRRRIQGKGQFGAA